MDDHAQTRSRKLDHVRIVLDENVHAKGISTDFARWRLPHDALPDVDMAAIDLRTTFLGKPLQAPLLISSMTGGAHDVTAINVALANAAQHLGLAMGVGSQRAAIGDAALAASYQIRRVAPDIALYANLGAVQLNYGYGVSECQRAVDMIEADALILHLNALQEAVQPEGNTNFAGLLPKIAAVRCRCRSSSKKSATGLAPAPLAGSSRQGSLPSTSLVRVALAGLKSSAFVTHNPVPPKSLPPLRTGASPPAKPFSRYATPCPTSRSSVAAACVRVSMQPKPLHLVPIWSVRRAQP
jgi:hypothetical protein